jgi:transcriptional regulator with XRE-family HTH domain
MAKKPHETDIYVGQRVRARRMTLGMSQETLGKRLKLTFQQVQKYEKGSNRISASKLAQIAAVLQIAPGYFFEGAPGVGEMTGGTAATIAITKFLGETGGMRMMRHWFALTDLDRTVAVAMVATLAEARTKK